MLGLRTLVGSVAAAVLLALTFGAVAFESEGPLRSEQAIHTSNTADDPRGEGDSVQPSEARRGEARPPIGLPAERSPLR